MLRLCPSVWVIVLLLSLNCTFVGTARSKTKTTPSATASVTASVMVTMSPSVTLSASITDSVLTVTGSETGSQSPLATLSVSASPVVSVTPSSLSKSTSRSLSNPKSHSASLSPTSSGSNMASMSWTSSPTETLSGSAIGKSSTRTITAALSATLTTRTKPPTPSRTAILSPTKSNTVTASVTSQLSPTKSSSASMSQSGSLTTSQSQSSMPTGTQPSASASLSASLSSTNTRSATFSLSRSSSDSLSQPRSVSAISITQTLTLNITESFTSTYTQQTTETASSSPTLKETPSMKPPTTTHVPTPSQTLLTKCPPCGNGTCTTTAPYICQCYLSYKLGFWSGGGVQGATCIECLANFYGAGCRKACPGGICTPCSNHGTCSDGVRGTGVCSCFNNASVGYWTGTACSACADGYYGADCKGVCACVAGQGTCRQGITGDGTCVCASGRTGARCESCTTGFYKTTSGSCTPCPGYVDGSACNGHGQCDPSTGICYCTGTYTTASNCSESHSGTVNGCVPTCQNGGNCTYGSCVCPAGFVGPQCQGLCPLGLSNLLNASSTAICAGRGQCTYNATSGSAFCACFAANDTTGHYANESNCSACVAGYGGTGCFSQCPASALYGVCSYQNIASRTLSQLCNATMATCSCPSGRCGADCSISTDCNLPCSGRTFGTQCLLTCVNGTVFPFRNSTGACVCYTGWVGTQCDTACGCANTSVTGTCPYNNETCVCKPNYAGRSCSTRCPFTANGTCSGRGTCDEGNTGSGLCRCNSGFVGVACDVVCRCVNASFGSCDATGACTCSKSTWRYGDDCGSCLPGRSGSDCRTQCVNGTTNGTRCVCLPTFGGAGCGTQCPSIGGVLCGGHGYCDDGSTGTGKCVCNASYYGPACNCTNAFCAATKSSNSVCVASTGVCTCVLPFAGSSCTSCADGFWGFSCTDVCSCSHGTCDRLKGNCTCHSSPTLGYWTGSDCSSCQTGYNLPDCLQIATVSSQLTGMRSVYASGALFYTSYMLLLFESYDVTVAIGGVVAAYASSSQDSPSRLQQVPFSSLVPSAQCTFAHAWSGTASSTVAVVAGTPSVFIASLCPQSGVFNGSTSSSLVVVITEFPLLPLTSFLSATQIANQTRFANVFVGVIGGLMTAVRGQHFIYSDGSDYLALAATADIDNSGTGVNGLYSIVFDDSLRVQPSYRWSLQTRALLSNVEAIITSVNGIGYDAVHHEVLLVGSFDSSGLGSTADRTGVYILSFSPIWSSTYTQRFRSSSYQTVSFAQVLSLSASRELVAAAGGTSASPAVFCYVLMQVSNGTTDLIRVNASARAYTVSYPSAVALTSSDAAVAIAYDAWTGSVLIVANYGKTFKLVRVVLSSTDYVTADGGGLEMLGSQLLPTVAGSDRRMISTQLSNTTRQLFLLQVNSTGTAIRRFILYETLGIFPASVSRFAGPTITITGRGFASPQLYPPAAALFPSSVPLCRVTSGSTRYSVPAMVLSATTALCTLAASNSSLCSADIVEVIMFSSFATSNGLTVSRFADPQLNSVSPSIVTYASVQASSSLFILINGTGFVQTGVSLCRWTLAFTTNSSYGANGYQLFAAANASTTLTDTVGTFISSTTMNCTLPALPRAAPLFVNVACDGQIFTSTQSAENVLFVVGRPFNITTSISSISVTSAAVVPLPSIGISFIDDMGSGLANTVSDRITASVSFVGGLVGTGVFMLTNNIGYFLFSNLALTSPTSNGTKTYLQFTASPIVELTSSTAVSPAGSGSSWSATVAVTVVSGAPYRLVMTTGPSQDTGIPESNDIGAVEVLVQDVAGNKVTTIGSGNDTYTATVSISSRVAAGIVIPSALYAIYPASEMANVTVIVSSGIASFGNIIMTNARGGMLFTVTVTTNITQNLVAGNPILSIATAELVPRCNAGKIRFIGDATCRACPSHMQCPTQDVSSTIYSGNATLLVSVDDGYWRSSLYATDATACSPSTACVGGTGTGACAEGYAGPLCGQCADGFGRSIVGADCVQCLDSRLGSFLFSLLLLLLLGFFIGLTIYTVQNWAVTMEPLISLLIMISHIQTVLGLGLTGFPFSQYFRDTMSHLGLFNGRILDYYFSDCVLASQGLTFYNKLTAYAAMPLIVLFLSSVAWLVVFLFPGAMKNKRAHDERHEALSERRDVIQHRIAKRRDALLQRQRSGVLRSIAQQRVDRLRLLADQAELSAIDDELKQNLKAQGILQQHDYRLLAAHAAQVVFLFTFQTVQYYCFTIFDCQDVSTGLGSTESYLTIDNRVSCSGPQYSSYTSLAYFTSVALLLIVPGFYVLCYSAHLRFRPAKVLQRRQLFYVWGMGVRTGSWYWPAVVTFRKGLQYVVAARLGSPADSEVAVWLLVAQLVWLCWMPPYWNHQNTLLEGASLVSCTIAASICSLFSSYGTDQAGINAISGVVLSCVLVPIPVFLGNATMKLWRNVREELRLLRAVSDDEYGADSSTSSSESDVDVDQVPEKHLTATGQAGEGKKVQDDVKRSVRTAADTANRRKLKASPKSPPEGSTSPMRATSVGFTGDLSPEQEAEDLAMVRQGLLPRRPLDVKAKELQRLSIPEIIQRHQSMESSLAVETLRRSAATASRAEIHGDEIHQFVTRLRQQQARQQQLGGNASGVPMASLAVPLAPRSFNDDEEIRDDVEEPAFDDDGLDDLEDDWENAPGADIPALVPVSLIGSPEERRELRRMQAVARAQEEAATGALDAATLRAVVAEAEAARRQSLDEQRKQNSNALVPELDAATRRENGFQDLMLMEDEYAHQVYL